MKINEIGKGIRILYKEKNEYEVSTVNKNDFEKMGENNQLEKGIEPGSKREKIK